VEDDCRSARSVVQGHLKWAVGCLMEQVLIECDKSGAALERWKKMNSKPALWD